MCPCSPPSVLMHARDRLIYPHNPFFFYRAGVQMETRPVSRAGSNAPGVIDPGMRQIASSFRKAKCQHLASRSSPSGGGVGWNEDYERDPRGVERVERGAGVHPCQAYEEERSDGRETLWTRRGHCSNDGKSQKGKSP